MWRRLSHVRTDVLEERFASIFRLEIISDLRTFVVTSKLNHAVKLTANIVPSSFYPEDKGGMFLRNLVLTKPHTAFFIVTAVKSSNVRVQILFYRGITESTAKNLLSE
jgi:hypothetical protein